MAADLFQTTAGALSMLAPVGAALYYGGKDSSKSVGTFLATAGAATLVWALVAYSVVFGGPLPTFVIGNTMFATINLLPFGQYPEVVAAVVTELNFVLLTINIIAGAVGYRLRAKWLVLLLAVWVVAVYAPQAFWQLNVAGWAWSYGILDFAGGLLVHVSAGVAALVIGVLAGPGKKAPEAAGGIQSLASVAALLVGTFFLNAARPQMYAGAFNFTQVNISHNGYTGVMAGNFNTGMSALALLNTQMALAGGIVGYAACQITFAKASAAPSQLLASLFKGEATLAGFAKGGVLGLVACASGAGYILPLWVFFIAVVTAAFVYVAERASASITLPGWGAFLTHGFGGAVGVACTGLFANTLMGSPANGSWYYNAVQLGKQCAGISYIILMTGVATAVIYLTLASIARFLLGGSLLAVEAAEEAAAPVEGAKAVVAA